jgi:hypothetical protein
MATKLEPPEHRQLRLSVRPVRYALVMPDMDEWLPQARRVIEYFSRTWGGYGNIVVTCDEYGAMPETSMRLLEMFDPDRLGTYVPTLRGFQLANPAGFKKWVNNQARKLARRSGEKVAEVRPRLLDEHFLSQPTNNWRPPDETSEALLDRLSTFHWENHVFQDHVTAEGVPQYHYVDMANLEPVESSRRVVLPETAGLPPELALLLETRFGQVATNYEETLRGLGVDIERSAPTDTWLSGAITQAWTNEASRTSLSFLSDDESSEPPWMLLDGFKETPFGRTCTGLGSFRPFLTRWDERPFVFVVGNTLGDFALALSLNRMTSAAAWVPEKLLRPRNARMAKLLLRAMASVGNTVTGYGHDNRPVLVTSTSLNAQRLQKVVTAVVQRGYGMLKPFSVEAPDEILKEAAKLRGVERLLDLERNDIIQYEPFEAGRQASLLNTPLPTALPSPPTTKMTWMVDVDVESQRVPARSQLSPLMAEFDSFDRDIRASRDGVSYFSQTGFIQSGTSLDKTLSRPRLRLVDAVTVFRTLLPDGWSCTPSQAGRLARAILDLFGSMQSVNETLLDGPTFSLLRAYLSDAPSNQQPGVFLDTVKRRYLTFAHAMSVTGGDEVAPVRQLLDGLLERGVIQRGLILDCGVCSYDGWYPLEELGEDFRCPRCRARTRLAGPAWKLPPEEPLWFYALSEVVFQFLKNNGHATLLALRKLQEQTRAFMFEPEMDIKDGVGWGCELDIWVVRDGRIAIGEAKTVDRLGTPTETTRLLENLRRAALALRAREVVFATTAVAWQPSVERKVAAAFEGTGLEVHLLTGLLSSP